MIYKISTTGTVSEVVLHDMGARTLTHPVVELDLGLEYSDDELLDSEDLAAAIADGSLDVVEQSGGPVTAEEVETISSGVAATVAATVVSGAVGGETATFLGLTDTPSSYSNGGHFRSTASGIVLDDHSIEYSLYVSPNYNGDYSDGTREHPFKTIQELAQYSYTTYTGIDDAVTIHCLPGVYYFDDTTFTQNPTTKAIVGTDLTTVIFKPTEDLIGKAMLGTYVPVSLRNVTIDGTDTPAMRTTPGSIAYTAAEGEYNQISITDCVVKGFYQNLVVENGSNIYIKGSDLSDTNTNITVGSGSLFDSDNCYFYNAEIAHIRAQADSEVYIEGTEIYSWEMTEVSGTGVWAEDDAYVELFGGTNLWGLQKNLRVEGNATIRVDNCVVEDSTEAPGIYQGIDAELIIINSRCPLDYSDLDLNNPDGVYINAYDSTNGRTTQGKASDVDNTMFSVNIGLPTNPTLDYDATSYDHKGLIYTNHTDGIKTVFGTQCTNEEVLNLLNTRGNNAWDHGAYTDYYSEQSGALRGWRIGKDAGSAPAFVFKYMDTTLALQLNNDGTVQLASGEKVNKILDEDNLDSNDRYALATQRSIRSYLTGNYYTSTALDNGQLDTRYPTISDMASMSGVLDNKFVYLDGTKPLTGDWDAGDYEITADGFNKGNTEVDLAVYGNTTGILEGGNISVNGSNPYMLDVASGTAIYTNMVDPLNPIVETITWPQQTISGALGNNFYKWIGVYRSSAGQGSLITDHEFSALEKRTVAVLGKYWSTVSGSDEITNAASYSNTAFGTTKTAEDFIDAYGSVNILGNVYSMSTETSMQLARTEGQAFRAGANKSAQPTSPNIYSSTADLSISSYYYQRSMYYDYEVINEIEPNYYDLDGVKTLVPSDKWTVQRVYYFAVSNVTVVFWGQHIYDSVTLAYDGIFKDEFNIEPGTVKGGILRAYLIVKQGATDLTDPTQAKLYKAYGRDGVLPGKSNHGELGGLADDDHPQYHTDARGDERYYTKDQIVGLTTEYVNVSGTNPLEADWDAGNYTITADGFTKGNTDVDLASFANITGVLTGGALTINADPTKLDVAAGTCIYVDMSDRTDPTVEVLEWPATTIDSGLAGIRSKWIGAYKISPGVAGITTDTEFTQLEKRSIAVIGRYWGDGTATITGKGNYTTGAFSFGKSMEDLAYALGSLNITGNVISAGDQPMKLSRSAGQALRFASGYSSSNINPNIRDSVDQNNLSVYQYHVQGATSTVTASGIDPDYYDNSGTKTAVPTDKWTTQRVYYFPGSSNVHVVYDQDYYDSSTLAYDGVIDTNLVLNEQILSGSVLRAYLILKQGCTDLTDDSQAKIITAYSEEGLLPGYTNHGQMDGLGDDDHPQYHNDTRGDARYYTQTEIDTWRDEHVPDDNHDASEVTYTGYNSPHWDVDTVEEALDEVLEYTETFLGTGRIYPENSLVQTGMNEVTAYSGAGYISATDYLRRIEWNTTAIDTTGFSEGVYYVYVDTTATVQYTTTEIDHRNFIHLGLFYYGGSMVALTSPCGTYMAQALNGTSDYLRRLGVFIYDDGCKVRLMANETQKILSTAGKVQYVFTDKEVPEIDTDDLGMYYMSMWKSPDMGWSLDYYFANEESGAIPINRYNNTTASGAIDLSAGCSFTNTGTSVTSTSNLTSEVSAGDMIYLASDTYNKMTLVSGVNWTGTQTDITLYTGYRGSTSTGTTRVCKSLPPIPENKFAKHLIARDIVRGMYFIPGNQLFDSYDEAQAGPGPEIPDAIEQVNFKLAYIIVTPTVASGSAYDTFNIIDIRPLPFHMRDGGQTGTSTGEGGVSDHGDLTGLADDDHMQYVLKGGGRRFTGKTGYESHPTFSTDTDIVDKKYVDDEIAGLTTDHGTLDGLSDDDHTQYTKADGTRAFTGTVSYSSNPTFSDSKEIVDKNYVDNSISSSVVTDHGNLTGLSDDDHTQYIRVDGTRDLTNKLSYNGHPTFLNDVELVDKKYVDDEITNHSTDHGELTGLTDDDHSQYHNDARGDARYYTKASLNAGQLDNRYYTETEVDNLVSSSVVTDHGGLTGLGDDDHTIYTKADGSRAFTAKISYAAHPTFLSDTELVDKKYVDDEIDNLTTDHGELTGLADDDHTQYHNDTRGDARYYTQSQVDTAISNHHASSSTDHDDRYYTETEVDNLLTTLSGSIDDDIANLETGNLPACFLRRTTTLTFPTSWGNVTFNTTEVETDDAVLEHNSTNTERIDIKENGLYLIRFQFDVERSATGYSYGRVVKNGTTVINGSETTLDSYVNETHTLISSCLATLQKNDYITVQVYEGSTGSSTSVGDGVFAAVGLKGLRGEKGDDGADGADGAPGSGSTVHINQDASRKVTGASVLNFTGNVTVTSGTSSANIDVTAPKTIQCYSTDTSTNLNNSTPVAIAWGAEDLKDNDTFTHSTTVNNTRIYVDKDGWYEVSYSVYYSGASGRTNVRGRIRKNGTTYLGRGVSVDYTRNSTNDSGQITAGPFLVELDEDDYIELMSDQQGDGSTVNAVSGDNYIRLTHFR